MRMIDQIYTPISQSILDAVREAEEIVVIGHSSPDGDCIFSQLACRRIFTQLGKSVTLLNEGPFTRDEIMAYEKEFLTAVPEGLAERRPLVVVVDCSTFDRPGSVILPFRGAKTVVFDHHSSGEQFTSPELMYIKSASVSTSLIIDHLRESLSVELDYELALYIYKGFATDTGFFHFLSERNGGETLRRVSHLVDQGVSPYVIYDEMHDGKPLAYFSFVSTLIQRVRSAFSGRLLYTYQKEDDVVEGKPADDVYSQLLQVSGVRVVLFFKEKDGFVEIGMRSKNKSGIDIGAFASAHGGGGHMYAAGAMMRGRLDEVMDLVIRDLSSLL